MSTDSKQDALARGREEILDRLFRVLVSASLVPAIAGTVLAIQADVPAIAVVDTLGWLLLLSLSRMRGQVARRGASLVVILLVVGVVVVSSVGPYGVGFLWMVAAPSLGGVFFGRRGLWVTSLALLACLGGLFGVVQLGLGGELWQLQPPPMVWWVLAVASTVAISVVTTLPSVELVRRLSVSIGEAADARASLQAQVLENRRLYEEFEQLFALTPQALILVTTSGRIRLFNPAAAALLRPDEGAPLTSVLPELPSERDGDTLVQAKRSWGRPFWLEVSRRSCVIRGVSFELICCVDVDVRERSRRQLAESIREREALLKEIHHRVKNNLQVTASLLQLQSGAIDSAEAQEALRQTTLRIQSMALVHELLFTGDGLASVRLDHLVDQLAREVQRTLDPSAELVIEVTEVQVALAAAIPCSLILNELLSLLLTKLTGHEGRSSLTVRGEEADGRIMVRVDATGLDDLGSWLAESANLGARIVSSLVQQVRGSLSVEGRTVTLVLPLPDTHDAVGRLPTA